MLYVGGICNDKEQLNLIKRVSARDSVLFAAPFSALLNAGCFCLTEYCIHTGNNCLVLMNEKKGKYDCRGHAFFVLDQL